MSIFRPGVSPSTKLTLAFEALRAKDYAAYDGSISCCQSCGWAEINQQFGDEKNAVFFHDQDEDNLGDSGAMHLAWRGSSDLIIATLRRAGIEASIGSPTQRIKIAV